MLEIDFKFPDWKAKLKAREQELNLFLAANIQMNRGMLFDTEGSHNGHARWAPLVLRAGQILSNRGILRKSISPKNPKGTPGADGIVRFAGDTIIVGTTLLYARMMNDGTAKMPGGVLRPKNAKALKIPLPAGDNATKTTRTLRAASTLARIDKLNEGMARAREREAKSRARFHKTGSHKHLEATVSAYAAVLSRKEKMDELHRKAERIRTTGKGGQGFIFRKSVKIPPRNFVDWNDQDQAEIDGALLSKVTEILNG